MNILNDISAVYLQQIAEKKDDSYLETDMEKRHENNEKAREDMKKTKAYKDMAKSARKSMGIDDEDDEDDINEATYSAKAARAGKDIGKPGKAFAKIAKSAAERYGSEERGKKVAGAVLAKLRKEALDPVGQEDSDIDNDGDTDKSDKYLHKRRKAIGNAISKKKSVKEALDPVGQEDDDIDNDGDTDSSDKYLHKRRKAIGKAISKKDVKEGFSNWRQDLSEVMDEVEANKEIKEKKVNNKIKINPELKEAVEQLGGELIEMVELDEKTLTSAETKKKEEIVKSMKKSAGDFEKRYPGRGKEVMYATATKMAKKVAEDVQQIDERRREDKGTPRPQRDRALEVVKGMIRQQTGTPAGQRKKVPGKKPPTAGQYGAPKSPAQKLKLRKAQQQRSQDWQQDTKGT